MLLFKFNDFFLVKTEIYFFKVKCCNTFRSGELEIRQVSALIEEILPVEKVFEKNKIQRKYEMLILEGIYDKNIEREIVKIKMGFDLEEEKVKKIMKYNILREKLFGSKEREKIEWD